MKLAVERERVFTLRTFEEKRLAAEEYERLNPIVKPSIAVKADEREESVDSDYDSEEDSSKVVPTPNGAGSKPMATPGGFVRQPTTGAGSKLESPR